MEEGSHRRHRRDHEHNKRRYASVECLHSGLGQEAHARKEDTKMLEQISRTMSRSFSIPARIHISSLDSCLRRKEAQRIVAGNKKLLTRIQSAKSDYDFSRFDTEYIRHQKYALNSSFSLRKKCEKILKIIPPHKTRYNPPQ